MDLYHYENSAVCRAVRLTAAALGLKLNLIPTDILADETKTPEFLAINPQHCVPTLVDGDVKLWESRVICTYLVSRYGKDDSLYPKDPITRSLVDRLLYFDMGTLFQRLAEYVKPVIFQGQPKDPAKLELLQEALGWLNNDLDGKDFAVGSNITVADHSLFATVSSIDVLGFDLSKHPNVVGWLKRCKDQMPGCEEANNVGARAFAAFVLPKFK